MLQKASSGTPNKTLAFDMSNPVTYYDLEWNGIFIVIGEIMKCRQCGTENDDLRKFCSECGEALVFRCPKCNAENKPADKFCGECGAPLKSETSPPSLETRAESTPKATNVGILGDGENRLVTVLFADMSSSVQTTRDLDPEDAADLVNTLLRTMMDVLSRFQCRIDNIVGDEVVAVFGTPTAREDDARQAIDAGLQICESVGDLGLNASVGINTGEVYFGPVGSDERKQTTVMGPVVNLAARLQGKAAPGEVIVGSASYTNARKAFAFKGLEVSVKGIEEPVRAYRVEGRLDRPDKVRGIEGLRARMIGRDEELTLLEKLYEEALNGTGKIVSVVGEAGIGKSRLIAELRAYDRSMNDTVVVEGRCMESGVNVSYLPFIDLFRSLLRFSHDDDDEKKAEKISSFVTSLVDDKAFPAERSDEIAPVLANMLSVSGSPAWQQYLMRNPERLKENTYAAIRDILVGSSKKQLLLLILEDLHWCDSMSLDLLPLLMDDLSSQRMMIICAYRPEGRHKGTHLESIAQQKCGEHYREMRLRDLSRAQSAELVEALLKIENLPPAVKESILDKSQGNPFFVEEVIGSLIDRQLIYQRDAHWYSTDEIEYIEIPQTVHSVVVSRVDRLSENLRSLLRVVSIQGRLFRPKIIRRQKRVTGDIADVIDELEERRLIYLERSIPEEKYSFKHVLFQESVYAGMLKRQRKTLHNEVAEAIEDIYSESISEHYDELAYHYEHTGEAEKTIEYLQKASATANRRSAFESAIYYTNRALELLSQLPISEARNRTEIMLLLSLFTPIAGTKGWGHQELLDAMSRAYQLDKSLPSSELTPMVTYGLLGSNMIRGDMRLTERIATEYLALAEGLGDKGVLMQAHRMLDKTYAIVGHFNKAIFHNEKSMSLYDRSEHRHHTYIYSLEPEATLYSFRALTTWILGRPDTALRYALQALQVLEDFDHPASFAYSRMGLCWIHTLRQDYEAAIRIGDENIRYCREINASYAELCTEYVYGAALAASGDVESGIDVLEKAYETAKLMETEAIIPMDHYALADAYRIAGKYEDARRVIETCFFEIEGKNVRFAEAETHRVHGEIMLAEGDEDGSENAFRKSVDVARKEQARSWELRAAISYARLKREQGRSEEAKTLLSGVYDCFTEGFDTTDLNDAKALLEEL